jgi:hypothetical protein
VIGALNSSDANTRIAQQKSAIGSAVHSTSCSSALSPLPRSALASRSSTMLGAAPKAQRLADAQIAACLRAAPCRSAKMSWSSGGCLSKRVARCGTPTPNPI